MAKLLKNISVIKKFKSRFKNRIKEKKPKKGFRAGKQFSRLAQVTKINGPPIDKPYEYAGKPPVFGTLRPNRKGAYNPPVIHASEEKQKKSSKKSANKS